MSVTAAKGFAASGVACGIKESGSPDLALVAADPPRPVPCAGVFTSNLSAAAPVVVSRSHLASSGGYAAAVLLNSGCANAATGERGHADALAGTGAAAAALGVAESHVLVCSTGLIGIPLPAGRIEGGIPRLVAALGSTPEAGVAAAEAIMTTDTRRKEVVVAGRGFVVGGMAKGAAMLAPNMATMLAVLTTDAKVEPALLQRALGNAVRSSFNEMTVDGCTSTNDTVIVLAGGEGSGGAEPDQAELEQALTDACQDLSDQMAADAEGATKLVRIRVTGARSHEEARAGARRVAESQLVKCSFYGEDPYWGRIVSELGSAGIAFDIGLVSVAYGGDVVCRGGSAHPHDTAAVAATMKGRILEIECDLGLGDGSATVTTTDLTHAYIDENMRTS